MNFELHGYTRLFVWGLHGMVRGQCFKALTIMVRLALAQQVKCTQSWSLSSLKYTFALILNQLGASHLRTVMCVVSFGVVLGRAKHFLTRIPSGPGIRLTWNADGSFFIQDPQSTPAWSIQMEGAEARVSTTA